MPLKTLTPAVSRCPLGMSRLAAALVATLSFDRDTRARVRTRTTLLGVACLTQLQAEAELLEAQREEGYILQLLSIAIDEQHDPGVRQVCAPSVVW